MKHFFDKMFRPPLKNSETLAVLPPLPAYLTRHEAQEKAVIGWIARRIGQLLPLDAEEMDLLFYTAFSYPFGDKRESEFDTILYFAEHLVHQGTSDGNVIEQVSDMMLTSRLETCLTRVAEEYHRDLSQDAKSQNATRQNDVSAYAPSDTMGDGWDQRVWQVYRDVIYAASQKKFLLITDQEVQQYLMGNIYLEMEIKERTDITKCREHANQVFSALEPNPSLIMSRLLVISEAVTNILKHAEYGKMTLVEDEQSIRAIIQDKGPGFSMDDLPNATLLAGYSTKKSLGQGFTLMMKMSDQVLLSTSPQGSTVILIFNKSQGKE